MNAIFDIIAIPMKYILEFFNSMTGSYALAILIFTVLINLALSPLNIKQQKTMVKQAKLRPKLDELKEKYGDDRQKYSLEMQQLYTREGVNPTGGCLPLFIRMIILLGVYRAVYALKDTVGTNFNLFGLDLSQTPHFSTDILGSISPIWIIPILSGVASLLSMLISNRQQRKNNPQMAQAGNSMVMMMVIMPLFSVWIAFSVPGAVGYYWIISNIVNTAIQLVVNHLYSPDKMIAVETAEIGAKRRKYETTKIEGKK